MTFAFIGDAVSLDFANTADWHLGTDPGERILTYGDLLTFAEQAGVLDTDDGKKLRRLAQRQPARAEQARLRAITLRESMFRLFLSACRQQPPDPADVEVFNGVLSEAMARAVLRATDGAFSWDWAGLELDRPLWSITRSAAELLTGTHAKSVILCHGDRCGWLFLDRTHRRRWCSMKDCGNRAKAARHYERIRTGRAR